MQDGSRQQSGGRRFAAYLAASLALLVLGPLLLGGVGGWAAARFSDLVLGREGDEAPDVMRAQLVELMLENAALREEVMKAERYRLLLGITRTIPRRAMAGRILYRSEGLVGGAMVVDRGTLDGVTVNSVCLAPAGLVGVVTSCTGTTCDVLPLTSPRVMVSCVTRRSGAVGILSSSDGRLRLLHIDSSREVEPGEEVVTSRFGGVYPDGLLVGTVVEVVEDSPASALELTVDPAVDFETLGEVLILVGEESVVESP